MVNGGLYRPRVVAGAFNLIDLIRAYLDPANMSASMDTRRGSIPGQEWVRSRSCTGPETRNGEIQVSLTLLVPRVTIPVIPGSARITLAASFPSP